MRKAQPRKNSGGFSPSGRPNFSIVRPFGNTSGFKGGNWVIALASGFVRGDNSWAWRVEILGSCYGLSVQFMLSGFLWKDWQFRNRFLAYQGKEAKRIAGMRDLTSMRENIGDGEAVFSGKRVFCAKV